MKRKRVPLQLVIFSDLDGSLLDACDYGFGGARPALERIKERKIPLILTTSKTRAEVENLQRIMGLEEPFIVENGGAIFFPAGKIKNSSRNKYHVIQLGKPYAEIRAFVKKIPPGFGVRGFGDLSVREISDMTGLSPDEARLAKKREFTEPFLHDGKHRRELASLSRGNGIKIVRGGRFHHFIGEGQDKGKAVKTTKDVFRHFLGNDLLFVGLGDSANDIPMLENVDIPVLIPHADGAFEPLELPNLIRAPLPGSAGWNDAVLDIFSGKGICN
jgi:mannosyl-3-phosphoglycerate phosphatase